MLQPLRLRIEALVLVHHLPLRKLQGAHAPAQFFDGASQVPRQDERESQRGLGS